MQKKANNIEVNLSVIYCHRDGEYYDLDYEVEHLDDCPECNPDLAVDEDGHVCLDDNGIPITRAEYAKRIDRAESERSPMADPSRSGNGEKGD